MKKLVFARLPGDTRFRSSAGIPFADGVPRSASGYLARLLEAYPIIGNKGNMLIGESLTKLLRFNRADSCCLDIRTQLDAGVTPEVLAETINRRFDAAVFPMANTIQPNVAYDYSGFAKVIESLEVDILVLGVGMQEPLPQTPAAISPSMLRMLTAMNNKAAVFGVRGAETEAWLRGIGLSRAKALGCPSLYVYPENVLGIRPKTYDRNSVAITAGYLQHRTRRSAQLLKLFRDHPAHYVMQDEVLHLARQIPKDRPVYNDATGEFDRAAMEAVIGKVQKVQPNFRGYWFFQDVDAWRQFCAHGDFFLGDRFHGAVAALQVGVPALIIHDDLRVRELTEFFQIPAIAMERIEGADLFDLLGTGLSAAALDLFRETYRKRFRLLSDTLGHAGFELDAGNAPREKPSSILDGALKTWRTLVS